MVRLAALSACLVVAGCGAKTGLRGAPSSIDGGIVDARRLPDAPRDVPIGSDAPCLCVTDADCDDGVSCTVDLCADCVCLRDPIDTACDDFAFCNGSERCAPDDPRATPDGCAPGRPVACDDGVSCTVDACDETLDACVATPEVSLCPISHRCDPVLGCLARALAHDATTLYEIDVPSGDMRTLGPLPMAVAGLTDIALHPDGRLFGSGGGSLWLVDYVAGTASMVVPVPGIFNALDFAPDGRLYGAVDDRVVRIDVDTGAVLDVATFPSSLLTSGDVAFIGDTLYATVTRDHGGDAPDILVRVDVDAGTASIVNAIREPCVWGLAPFGTTLYGLTCDHVLIEIDTTTGRGTRLREGLVEFYGAAAR